ncbi:MAG: helix-hairpin-helix domain-containing protein [Candidatus Eisenbacteria bacterium]|nr:helix-hairpin-helix domain-containing protein [Candidatus Eisenbacteria bacterium]
MTPGARALLRMGLASAVAVLIAVLAHRAPVPAERLAAAGGVGTAAAAADAPGAEAPGSPGAGLPPRGAAWPGEPGGHRLSLNRASQADLEALPGIGPALARRILEFRASHGPFRSAEELLLVRGIGPRKWAALRGLVAP